MTLVAEKKECNGSEIYKGKVPTVNECASLCNGIASMLIFGTKDFGRPITNNDGDYICNTYSGKFQCSCYCETESNENGTCATVDNDGFRLFELPKGRSLALRKYCTASNINKRNSKCNIVSFYCKIHLSYGT